MGDISSQCFPSIDHSKLMDILKERIRDKRFLEVIHKALKAGYADKKDIKGSLIGTPPQGSSISTILSNIYMDKLDKFVEKLASQTDKGLRRRLNPKYEPPVKNKRLVSSKSLKKKRLQKLLMLQTATLLADTEFRRLFYVRYADD